MGELIVNKKNFDNTIKKLDELSKENKKLPELKKFQEKAGPFELFSRHVKGEEMNEFASQVQSNFMALNEKTNQFYVQFAEVYNAFYTLDKEYISGIVTCFNQAVEANKKAELAQKDINATVDLLKATVAKIKEFNEKVNAELSLIDGDNWKENASKHQEKLDEIDRKANDIISTINEYKDSHNDLINQLNEYKKEKEYINQRFKYCYIGMGISFVFILILLILILAL